MISKDPVTGAHELDGPMILQLIVSSINPITRVGVSTYNMEIQTTTLQAFRNSVQETVDFMGANYEEIVAHTFTHPDYTMHLFNALLTSKNDIFRSMIQRLKDRWEIGENVEPDILIEATLTK